MTAILGPVMPYSFSQVDVFAPVPLTGNPVAVVHDATGLSDDQMAAFARWTNLSETTFLLPPTDPAADYRLRIFTPLRELPFAGHPTLGSAHAWLGLGGRPTREGRLVQECGVGLVELREVDGTLAFQAPELLRSGPVDEADLAQAVAALGIAPDRVVRAGWIDNGPGWLGLQLAGAADVLALEPDFQVMRGLEIGVLGAHETGSAVGADVEVRAFCPAYAVPEDPVTGSLNAGFALWLTREGHLPPSYTARQGTAMGRDGRVAVHTDDEGRIWVGGRCHTLIEGSLTL
ncbi:MAG: PhzF family phenazine biosynthesis protein [Marmoricola sp.]|nr:PhzF family phenazine biosynthesis protein [Marmoricola sp.]